ncbi:response regulator transcription factor [Paenibacillus filicis]|uniref:Response regulator transcription factor n=1 Tax=Paenibacillus filicis TaxID=669464 RepID=A0ABU9DGP7_9BACL
MSYNLLIVEDEPEIIELLTVYLDQEYRVFHAHDAQSALEQIRQQHIDLAILDIMMPGMDGFQLVKKIRETHEFPVLFLSALSQDHDKILGLSLGGDDYLTKPFNPLEVVARVQALLRRAYRFEASDSHAKEKQLVIGELLLDPLACVLYRSGRAVPLTSTEYKLMLLFMEHPGRVLTKKRIYETVWDDQYAYDDNTIMVHISNLRDKIEEDTRKPEYIKTIRGLGYKLETPVAY